jgi:WD40 repeat protein
MLIPEGRIKPVDCIAFSPDGKMLVSGGRELAIWVWDVETGSALFGSLKGPLRQIESLAFLPAGKRAVTGCLGGYLFWDERTWELVAGPFKVGGTIGSFSHDGKQLLSSGPAGIGIVDTRDWECHHDANLFDFSDYHLGPACFFPDDKRIAVTAGAIGAASGNIYPAMLKVLDVETGHMVSRVTAFSALSRPKTSIQSIGFSADGQRFVSGSDSPAEVRV